SSCCSSPQLQQPSSSPFLLQQHRGRPAEQTIRSWRSSAGSMCGSQGLELIPPSKACCAEVKKANAPCLCKNLPPGIDKTISLKNTVFVFTCCGRRNQTWK
ncbi:unnamed protein product, partial [Musa textilis]